ncbi:MAG: aminodeoxychorismate/anthranilate synthase component II [Bacteroidales bacterium]|jgi:anthranilate synthase component 2|nr:aminodeoxychorismate/anthranilate synthase component II [Bacteroidales bacterium]
MKILVFDNYDSFTYNLVHLIKELGYSDVEVHRNDKITLKEIERFDKIILSPGPGIPCESGILLDVIRAFAATKPIFGVCLGEQAIGEAFGAQLLNLPEVHHGISTKAHITDPDYIFNGLEKTIEVGRYHSWAVSKENFPTCLHITAEDENGIIMALKHKEYDVHGVQFHPESILTPKGKEILQNFLSASLSAPRFS